MNKYKTSAITLRTYDLNDYDKIAVLYSKEHGIIRAVAKGVKRAKSKIGGMLAPLVAANLVVNKGRNLDVIEQFELLDFFKGLKTDLSKITFASYYLELITAFGMEDDPHSEEMYEFLFRSLKKLEYATNNVADTNIADSTNLVANATNLIADATNEHVLAFFLVGFEYELIRLVGYEPLLNICSACRKSFGEGEKVYINGATACVFCEDCLLIGMDAVELSSDMYDTMLYFAGLKQLPDNLKTAGLYKLHEVLFTYISGKTGFRLKTPKLIETLCL